MRYKNHPEAVIISCFFNPTKSAYRRKAFDIFYESIRHLNHRIIECVGLKESPELAHVPHLKVVRTDAKAWHKETLLNQLVAELPPEYKYVFWLDADVIFMNPRWLPAGVEELKSYKVIQPFRYCIHLGKDEMTPSFDISVERTAVKKRKFRSPYKRMWRSFAATWRNDRLAAVSNNYDHHGHVGFAWGARRNLLDKVPLFDKALIGGADHIIAHASTGQLMSECIKKSFGKWFAFWWSLRWYLRVRGSISFVDGDLYHIWHGNIEKREYLKRIQDFAPLQKNAKRGQDGFHKPSEKAENYFEQYLENRERTDNSSDANAAYQIIESDSYSGSSSQDSGGDSWQSFGGGGDFAGGGAGGGWDSSDSSSMGMSGEASSSVDSSYSNFS